MSTFQLLYFSTATSPPTKQDMDDILETSRINNAKLEISGVLLYEYRHFMQVLEGGKEEVQALFQVIAEDPRHRDLVLVYETEIDDRNFAGWAMAHYEFSDGEHDDDLRKSFVKICEAQPEAGRSYPDLEQAKKFVGIFRRMLSGSGG